MITSENIRKAKEKNEKAFDSIYHSYKRYIHLLVYSKVGNVEDANDIVQEIFIKMYEKLCLLKNDRAFHSWFTTLANNTVNDYLRKKIRDKNNFDRYIKSEYTLVIKKEINLRDIYYYLEELDMQILDYKLIYNYSFKKIAEVLEMNQNTIVFRFNRSIKKIKETLINE